MTYSDYEPYCATERQKEIMKLHCDGMGSQKIASDLGFDDGSVRRSIRSVKAKAAKQGFAPSHDMTKVAPEGFSVKGTSTLYHPEKGIVSQWVKTTRNDEEMIEQIIDAIKDSFTDFKGKSVKTKKVTEYSVDDYLTAYVMGDPHFGMLAHADETDSADFNSEIARQCMEGGMNSLIGAAKPTSEALLVNVGDALHVDDSTNKTKGRGNMLDADSRYYKIIRVFCEAMIYTVYRMLEKHDHVTVINQSGNHDIDSTHWIQIALDYYFHNNPRVTIRINPSPYNWFRWEKNLIGVTHGDGAKMHDLPLIMASVQKRSWGETDHHYWWTGHIHHKQVQEFNGCKVESFNTMAPSDAWHARSGYFAAREMHSLTLHKKHGLVARNICPVGLALE